MAGAGGVEVSAASGGQAPGSLPVWCQVRWGSSPSRASLAHPHVASIWETGPKCGPMYQNHSVLDAAGSFLLCPH